MRSRWTIICAALCALLPGRVLAVDIPAQINAFGCNKLGLGLHCESPGVLFDRFWQGGTLMAIFGAFLFFMLVVYGIVLVARSRNEDAVTEALTAYGNALFAAFIIAAAGLLSDAFVRGGALPDTAPVRTILLTFKDFLLNLAVAALAANIAIQSIRLLLSKSDQGVEEARANLVRSLFGAMLLKLADLTILDLRPSEPGGIVDVLIGLANFAATIFGALAVLGLIAAGIMLIISVDESLKERAKKMIITSIVALIIVLLAKGIVSFFSF